MSCAWDDIRKICVFCNGKGEIYQKGQCPVCKGEGKMHSNFLFSRTFVIRSFSFSFTLTAHCLSVAHLRIILETLTLHVAKLEVVYVSNTLVIAMQNF